MSVQVAVRVRPFNQRETELNSSLCVEMKGSTTILIDPEDPQNEKKRRDYTFDYSFWSHDGFEINDQGLAIPTSKRYADQRSVYETVGSQILDNAWEGYNCCLFAYGQTGAGKSYSMVGYKPNKGIVPIACEEIFKRVHDTESDSVNYEVFCSMMEIYNEKVQDLLVPISKRPSGGLKIRENKAIGFYVDQLTKYPVESYEAIEQIMDDGSKNRTIASTQMNACSSRAHTIITIEFKRIEQTDIKKIEKSAVINLVDLAGSEKVGKTGASGDRLKEAGQINKSLSCLGLVISTLVDVQNGKPGKVPYRDSCLTKILANALGGNSRTLMICAISPSGDNYVETLSTLRYADQAKKIKNKATINESATDKLIRELTEENEDLKKKMIMFDQMMAKYQGNPELIMAAMGEGGMKQMQEAKDNFQANQNLMVEANKNYKQAVSENQQKHDDFKFQKVDLDKPHLTNLNEDPLLTRKVQYSLGEEKTHIGKKNGNPTPQIILNAMGIKENHATISKTEEGGLILEPVDTECGDYMFVNGDKVYDTVELQNQDRLIFGTNSTFLVVIPGGEPRHDKLPNVVDWEFAQEELNSKYDKRKKEEEEEQQKQIDIELQKKIQEVEDRMKKEQEETELKRKQQEEEYIRKIQAIEEKNKEESLQQQLELEKAQLEKQRNEEIAQLEKERYKKELEREKEKKKIQEQEQSKKNKIKEKNILEHKLQKILPRIVEINLFAKELKRNVYLQAKLAQTYYTELQNTDENKQQKKLQIQVQVFNREEGTVYLWDLNKFQCRYYIIKDLLDRYFETNKIPELNINEDPFWDPPEQQLIGQGFLKLLSLGYLMDAPSNITIVGDNGSQGFLKVNLIPTDSSGEINLGEDLVDEAEVIEDPIELLDKRLDFIVVIQSVKLPLHYKNPYVEYSLVEDNNQEQVFKTDPVREKQGEEYIVNYKMHHTVDKVTEEVIDYIKNANICFKVYSEEEIQQETNYSKQGLSSKQPGRNINVKQQILEEDGEQLHPNDLFTDKQTLQKTIQNATQSTDYTQPSSERHYQQQQQQQQQQIANAKMMHQGRQQQQQGKSKNDGRKSKDDKKNKNCNIF